jgi:hypothetical protein
MLNALFLFSKIFGRRELTKLKTSFVYEMYAFHTLLGIKSKRGHGRHDANSSVIRFCFADENSAAAFANEFAENSVAGQRSDALPLTKAKGRQFGASALAAHVDRAVGDGGLGERITNGKSVTRLSRKRSNP